jgi:hypothetical protein
MRSPASGVARRQNVNKKKIHDKELRGAIRKRVFQTCNAGRAGAQPYRATRRKGHRAKAGAFGYGGQKLELSLTRGKSWSLRLQRAKAGAFAYSGQKLELSLTAGKSWSFRLRRAKAGAFAYSGQKLELSLTRMPTKGARPACIWRQPCGQRGVSKQLRKRWPPC